MNATITDKPTTAEILERARRIKSWRRGFQSEPPDAQEAEVHQTARAIVLYESDLGKAAVAVREALEGLQESIETFLELAPNSNAAEETTRTILAEAGMADPPPRYRGGSFLADNFEYLPEELRGWLFPLQVMSERIEPTEMPDLRESRTEEDQ